jgi:Single-strand binding protein family
MLKSLNLCVNRCENCARFHRHSLAQVTCSLRPIFRQGGRTVTRLSIASTKKWTDKANKTHESTDWFRVAAWGNLTKFASSLKKGDPVLVQGELRTGESCPKCSAPWVRV